MVLFWKIFYFLFRKISRCLFVRVYLYINKHFPFGKSSHRQTQSLSPRHSLFLCLSFFFPEPHKSTPPNFPTNWATRPPPSSSSHHHELDLQFCFMKNKPRSQEQMTLMRAHFPGKFSPFLTKVRLLITVGLFLVLSNFSVMYILLKMANF